MRVSRQQRYALMACRELAAKVNDIGEQGKVSGSGLWFEHGRLFFLPGFSAEAARLMKRTVLVGR